MIKDKLQQLLKETLTGMGVSGVVPDVDISSDPRHGEYTSNVAMRVFAAAKSEEKRVKSEGGKGRGVASGKTSGVGKAADDQAPAVAGKAVSVPVSPPSPPTPLSFSSPMDLALQVAGKINDQVRASRHNGGDHSSMQIDQVGIKTNDKIPAESLLQDIDRIEAVAPGFLNFHLSEAKLSTVIQEVLNQGEGYGTLQKAKSKKQKAGAPTVGFVSPKPPRTLSSFAPPPLPPDFRPVQPGEKVMVEFAHPNTHKAFHIGHLRNISTGESIVRLLEAAGYDVIRANYQGDVGMHIAKCLYALLELSPYKEEVRVLRAPDLPDPPDHPDSSGPDLVHARVEFLGKAYAAGSAAFEDSEDAKAIIKDLNALIYVSAQRLARERGIDPGTTDYMALVRTKRYDAETVYTLWVSTRRWSLDYYETIYKRVFTHYDRLYFESECLAGVDLAKEAVVKGVLKESQGAIIFDGKPHGLDTRVFVNNLGLPTYEGKELKLASIQAKEAGKLYHLIHVVGPEQASFFTVAFKAEELLGILPPNVQYHHVYGWVKLKHGKMSSRLGNVVYGEMLLDEAKKSIYEILDSNSKKNIDQSQSDHPIPGVRQAETHQISGIDSVNRIPGVRQTEANQTPGIVSRYTDAEKDDIAEKAAVAAVKYAFLRVSTNQEIAFDLKESVAFDGDSGPYLLYTYARAKSVLRKANAERIAYSDEHVVLNAKSYTLNAEERNILRLLSFFPELVAKAASELAPNVIAKYLFDLSQAFNLFYQKHPILVNSKQSAVHGKVEEAVSSSFIVHSRVGKTQQTMNHEPSAMNDSSSFRLSLTAATAQTLANGLYLLGIETVEKM